MSDEPPKLTPFNVLPASKETVDYFNTKVNEVLVKFYATKIKIARLEAAQKRGEYRGGERRKRGARA